MLPHALLRNFALLEHPGDVGRRSRRERVGPAQGSCHVEDPGIACVGLPLAAGGSDGRTPVEILAIDGTGRDGLRHDALHHVLDELLTRERVFNAAGIVGTNLVAQVPVRQQAQLRGKQPHATWHEHAVHPDVVTIDVLLAACHCFAHRELHFGGHAACEPLCEAHFRPLPARPVARGRSLFERGQRKVQQRDKGQVIREEVVGEVRARVVAGKELIDRQHRTQFEILGNTKLAGDLLHVAVDLLEHVFEAREQRVQCRRVTRELRAHQFFEHRGATVFGTPHRSDLFDAPLNARALHLAVSIHQHPFGACHGGRRPVWYCGLRRRRSRDGVADGEDQQGCNGCTKTHAATVLQVHPPLVHLLLDGVQASRRARRVQFRASTAFHPKTS